MSIRHCRGEQHTLRQAEKADSLSQEPAPRALPPDECPSRPPLDGPQPRCGDGAGTKTGGAHCGLRTNQAPLEKGGAAHPSVLTVRVPQPAWNSKKICHRKMGAPGQKVSNMLLGKSEGPLLIAPERTKRLGQQKRHSAVEVSGGERKAQCRKERYCIGTWSVRSMNQSKLDMFNRRWQDWTWTS